MRRLLHILLLFFVVVLLKIMLIVPIQAQQRFTIIRDTVNINAADYISPISAFWMDRSIKYKDWYFCVFDEISLYGYGNKIMLAISEDGDEIKRVNLSSCYFDGYSDLFVRHDTLFMKLYYQDKSLNGYYFDTQTWKWYPIKYISDIIYEDDIYSIAYMSFGEWGDYTWFIGKSKNKKMQYINPDYFFRIIRIDSVYYFVHRNRVDTARITDTLGKLCKPHWTYKYAVANQRNFIINSERDDYAIEVFSIDSLPSNIRIQGRENPHFEHKYIYDTIFEQAFSMGGEMYYIINTPQETVITQVENGQLKKVLDLGMRYRFFKEYHSYRGVNIDDNQCFLQFEETPNTFGMLYVKDSIIHIRYLIHNQKPLPEIGTDNIKPLLNLLLNNFKDLSFDYIDSVEQQLGGISDNKMERLNNYYFPEEYQNPKEYGKISFYKVVDSQQTLKTSYCIHKSDSIVKAIFFEWKETTDYNSRRRSVRACKNVSEIVSQVFNIVTQITNSSPEQEQNYQKWTFNGWVIELYKNGRMLVY